MTPLSKEEIREKHLFENGLSVNKGPVGVKIQKAAYGAMDEWADQQSRIAAIGFAEFIEKRWMYDDESKTWTTFSKGDSPLTTEELYNLFLEHKSKQ